MNPSLNGGIEAPSQLRRPRRRTNKRAQAILKRGIGGVQPVDKAVQIRPVPPAVGGGQVPPKVLPGTSPVIGAGIGATPRKKRPVGRVEQGGQVGLGHQLSRRVESGAISQDQAEQVASDRRALQQAYGNDWRQEVYGDRGYMQRTRAALAENPDDPQIMALYQQLLAERKKALEFARGQKRKDAPVE